MKLHAFVPALLFVAAALSFISAVQAADCIPGGNLFTADIRTLSDDLKNNNFNPPIPSDGINLPSVSSFEATVGSVKACINNNFIFESTHDSIMDASFALQNIADQCCSTDTCGGGTFTIKGDTGLDTILRTRQAGEEC